MSLSDNQGIPPSYGRLWSSNSDISVFGEFWRQHFGSEFQIKQIHVDAIIRWIWCARGSGAQKGIKRRIWKNETANQSCYESWVTHGGFPKMRLPPNHPNYVDHFSIKNKLGRHVAIKWMVWHILAILWREPTVYKMHCCIYWVVSLWGTSRV